MKLPTSGSTDITSHTVQRILSGEPHILSYPGTGQYTQQGSSSCGLAALNSARCLLAKVQSSTGPAENLLQSLITRESVEDIMSICRLWASDLHLEVEEIARIPLFNGALKLVKTGFGACSAPEFKRLLSKQFSTQTATAAIITRPPEILTCFSIPLSSSPPSSLYILFDSHPRPLHPSGSGFLFSTSLDDIASHLGSLLSVEPTLLTDSAIQWEAQYLTQFSSHLFVSQPQAAQNESQEGLKKLVLESSLAAMEMRGRIRDMEWRIEFLTRQNTGLEAELAKTKVTDPPDAASLQQQIYQNGFITPSEEPASPPSLSKRAAGKRPENPPVSQTQRAYATAVAGPSKPRHTSKDHTPTISGTTTSVEPNGDWLFLKFNPEGRVKQLNLTTGNALSDSDYAARLQEWYNDSDPEPARHNLDPPTPSTGKTVLCSPTSTTLSVSSPKPSNLLDSDKLYALREQQRFDVENARLQAERSAALAQFSAPAAFKCGICMDLFLEDVVVRVPGCRHAFCRDCLKSYVSFKLGEHRFPVFCPLCTAAGDGGDHADMDRNMDRNGNGNKASSKELSAIDNMLAQQIGITEEENATWHELELARVSVVLSCRKCKRSAFVDREEYDAVKLIACPLPGCHFVWCKFCQQQVSFEGPTHSCDGSSELDHLVRKQGWKYCPGCKTLIQKTTGCNHMTCTSPGCNMHFCYLCGKEIVRSALNSAVKRAVSAHYSKCVLFHVPE